MSKSKPARTIETPEGGTLICSDRFYRELKRGEHEEQVKAMREALAVHQRLNFGPYLP